MSEIIPANWTPQEIAIATLADRATATPVYVRDVWSPYACPLPLLPWLAWALHVDNWEPLATETTSGWTEKQQRDAIAASIDIHRQKGTASAVRRALQAVGYEVEIDEKTGIPYTFRVNLNVTDKPVTDADYNLAGQIATENKNARSLLLGVRSLLVTSGNAYATAVNVSGEQTDVWPALVRLIEGTGTAFLAMGEQTIDTVNLMPFVPTEQSSAGSVFASGLINIELIYS